jgi:hypothetical protein
MDTASPTPETVDPAQLRNCAGNLVKGIAAALLIVIGSHSGLSAE